ncbi:hypothetical protein C8A01DRAFT_17418, partial [Parachaetomium inaequale]
LRMDKLLQMPTTTATGFPIMALPRELRDKIWEECFWLIRTGPLHPPCSPFPKHSVVLRDPNRNGVSLGTGHHAPFYTRQAPPIALVCRESREVARRTWSKGQKEGKPLWEHECTVPVLQQIDTARTDSSITLLAIHPPENHLVLDLRSELRPAYGGGTSPLASSVHGARLLDLVLAAKDDQIKVLLPETQTFCLPYGPGTPPLPPAAQGWLSETRRLVSVNDVGAWEELGGIAAHYGLPWPFADTVLGGLLSRAKLVADAVRPLQSLWERESARRKHANMGRLKPLPRIDAVTYVEVSRGGTIGMLGFKGVPDRAALRELLDYGVL